MEMCDWSVLAYHECREREKERERCSSNCLRTDIDLYILFHLKLLNASETKFKKKSLRSLAKKFNKSFSTSAFLSHNNKHILMFGVKRLLTSEHIYEVIHTSIQM